MTWAPTSSHGATVAMGNGASPEVFTALSGVQNGPQGLGFSPQIQSTRHHGSINTVKKVSGVEVDPVSFDLLWDSTDTGHLALQTAAQTGAKKSFKITYADAGAEVNTISGFISLKDSAPVDGFNVKSVTITPDGGNVIS